jgi:aspartyl-tRNA(Asn)/glutamyl-tRNA(Gln) amidotransferase subunit A
VNQPVPDYAGHLRRGIKGLRVGIPREYFVEGMQPEVEQAVHAAVRVLETLGAQITEVSLPHTEYAVPTYYVIATAEASSNLARYDGIKYGLRQPAETLLTMYQRTRAAGFGSEVKRRIMLGTYVLSAGYYDAYYLKAQKVRTLIRRDFAEVFATQDVIVTPTAPTTAFRIGEKTSDPLQMYLSDIFTISINLAGLPGISLPCGFDANGLPIGLQIVGRPFEGETVFRTAHAYEQATEWHERKPIVDSW